MTNGGAESDKQKKIIYEEMQKWMKNVEQKLEDISISVTKGKSPADLNPNLAIAKKVWVVKFKGKYPNYKNNAGETILKREKEDFNKRVTDEVERKEKEKGGEELTEKERNTIEKDMENKILEKYSNDIEYVAKKLLLQEFMEVAKTFITDWLDNIGFEYGKVTGHYVKPNAAPPDYPCFGTENTEPWCSYCEYRAEC
jgi:hypothetical protein